MTDRELQRILDAIQYVPDEKERDEVTRLILKAASESITLERLKAITTKEEKKTTTRKVGANGSIKFTKKEINSMPDHLRKLFTVNENIVTYRITKDGYYQARLRRGKYNIEVAAKDFATMKHKFLQKLAEREKALQNAGYPLFRDCIQDWLNVKKQTVKASTYKSYENLISLYLLPRFGGLHVNEIARKDVQNFLFSLTDEGKNRTAQKLKVLMTAIFDVICEDSGLRSPMSKIVLAHYEVKKGNAFTKTEEKRIVDFCRDHPQYAGNSALLVLLYTGMRVGELKSLTFDGTWFTCVSEKTRHGHAEIVRKIPVSPMMARVLPLIDMEQAKSVSKYSVRDALKRIFPKRHVHELRYSFITRVKECGVSGEVVMKWVGHEFDQDVRTSRVDRGYTDYSEEFMLKEIHKVEYEL